MPGDILVGLVGAGIQASRSPALHVREAGALGLRYFYRLFYTDELTPGTEPLPRLLEHAEALGYAGLNVTHPLKQRVIEYLDEVREEAAVLGAVNTVLFSDGRRIGYNTDWWGFEQSFRRCLPDARLGRVVVLGAGGAGSAVAYALLQMGASQIDIYDTSRPMTDALIARLQPHFPASKLESVTSPVEPIRSADGVVNATPVGMSSHPGSPISPEAIRPDLWVADCVYFPLDTPLLRDARDAGCLTLDGGGMAVFQAVRAFELFSGVQPDAERMLRHFAST